MPRLQQQTSMTDSDYSSYRSSGSYNSNKTYDTNNTSYSSQQADSTKQSKTEAATYNNNLVEEPVDFWDDNESDAASVLTYASTTASQRKDKKAGGPFPSERYQCYAPDSIPANSADFAALYPSSRRFMIQHDDTTVDGNMNLRIDTEVTTRSGRRRKVTLFHLRMKDLKERDFSLRRYCRDSGREVASCKKKYVKSTTHIQEVDNASKHYDSGYESEDDEELTQQMMERLNLMTSPSEDVTTIPTDGMRMEFSNYAQVSMDRAKNGETREYDFEYWGNSYRWRREKQYDDGELVYAYDLVKEGSKQRVASIMPDALSPQEAHWEAKQGGWIPASSMRIIQNEVSDDLGDVIVATGLMALTDDCLRRQFPNIDSQ